MGRKNIEAGSSEPKDQEENLFKTDPKEYTNNIINRTIGTLSNEAKRFAGVFNPSASHLRGLVDTFQSNMTGDVQKDMEMLEKDFMSGSGLHPEITIKREAKENREKDVLNAMKQISDFAKEKSNGWIYIGKTDAPNVGLVETKTKNSGTEITMSAMADLEEICNLFELHYVEESKEDGYPGTPVDIKDRDQLASAIEKNEYIIASLKE